MSAKISGVPNRLLGNYTKATAKLSDITSILCNLNILHSDHYFLNFAFIVRVIFDNVRRSNKPHSESFFTQRTTQPAIKIVAMACLRNNLKTSQCSMPNGSANFIYWPSLQPMNLFMHHEISMTFRNAH